ncbi:MAG: PAS domain-containing protein [Cyanobacteria bacterium SZAS-4]|nr:PAS domain-containing protein [Cyanobacteria bacterium SZAS-4]
MCAADKSQFEGSLLQSILSSLHDAVVAVDLKGRLIYSNEQAKRLLNLSQENESAEVQDSERATPSALEVIRDLSRRPACRALAGEVVEDCVTIYGAAGQLRRLMVKSQPLFDQQGTIIGAVEMMREVTSEIATTELEPQQQQLKVELFRQMFDMMPQLGWTAHADGNIDWYNRGWYEYTGKTLEEMKGWGWQSVHDPKYLPLVNEKWNHSIETGIPFEMKFPLKGKDEKFRWFLTRINPMRDESGALVRWVGINTDIQDEIDMQNQLKQMSEALPSVVWTTSADGFCNYLSPLWKDMTGFEPSECLGTKWLELLHPSDRDAVWETWQRCVESGTKFETEYRLRGKDGNYSWFLALGVPLSDASGNLSQWLGSLTNINDKKTRNEEMELMVNERTAQLQVARDLALVAKSTAEEALETKSRFISTISHEVRTPMTGIIGLAEVMCIQDLGDENNTCMQAIFDSSKRLLQLLNNVLDAAKLETGKVMLEHRRFPIQVVLGDVRQLIRPEASKKNLEISGSCDSEIPDVVYGDEFRLRQILLNLAFNAVKFTNVGRVDIGAKLVSKSENRVVIRFEVLDTGRGLTSDQISRLFRPFEQAEVSVARVNGGTGLGLSICKDLVSLMGGTIGVESKPDSGSTFWFEIAFDLDEVSEK